MSIPYSEHWIKEFSDKKCEYCGNNFEHLHHIVPRSLGGKDRYDNVICLCKECHLLAHNSDFFMRAGINEGMQTEFKQIVEKRMLRSINNLAEIIQKERHIAEKSNENKHWKKNKVYFRGKIEAFEYVLCLLDMFSLGKIPCDGGVINEKQT